MSKEIKTHDKKYKEKYKEDNEKKYKEKYKEDNEKKYKEKYKEDNEKKYKEKYKEDNEKKYKETKDKVIKYKVENKEKHINVLHEDVMQENKEKEEIKVEKEKEDVIIKELQDKENKVIQENQEEMQANLKIITRIFPFISTKTDMSKIQIDKESLRYVSLKESASDITQIILNSSIKKRLTKIIITDSMAGVGGNSISFCKKFSRVYSIELDEARSKMLSNNLLQVYKFTNVTIFNNDFLKVIRTITDHNVIFLDPPWGGKCYKDVKKLTLNIGDLSLEKICNDLLDDKIMIRVPEIIILKLPKNYDINYFYRNLTNKHIYYHDLKKMIILVIYKNL
jgi:16S rRNA G966 N2-methylase RsmD